MTRQKCISLFTFLTIKPFAKESESCIGDRCIINDSINISCVLKKLCTNVSECSKSKMNEACENKG